MSELSISLADIEQAATRLRGYAICTPLLESAALNTCCNGRVFIKPEILQHTGSFKFRGAFNKLSALTAEDRRRGVLAVSSGNHAQGVAYAAHLLGIHATIVMPADAPKIKIQRTQEYGASTVFYQRYQDDREAIAARLAEDSGAVVVPPFDDPFVMAGQGTAGLELCQQVAQQGGTIDVLLSPCGGGGLIAGVGTAVTAFYPASEIYAVEPENFNDTVRSLSLGKRVSNGPDARSICDALQSVTPGKLTFAINQKNLAGAFAVSDDEVKYAMRWAFEQLKLVIEPGGVVALAAMLAGRVSLEGRCAAIVLSGGNLDPADYAACLTAG